MRHSLYVGLFASLWLCAALTAVASTTTNDKEESDNHKNLNDAILEIFNDPEFIKLNLVRKLKIVVEIFAIVENHLKYREFVYRYMKG
jgi:hypothetical protein